jgi:hypothetical protein
MIMFDNPTVKRRAFEIATALCLLTLSWGLVVYAYD